MKKVGVLFIGALGHIAVAVMVGAHALARGAAPRTGMVTALEEFSLLDFTEPGDMVFGGWDIRTGTPLESAQHYFTAHHLLEHESLRPFEDALSAIARDVFRGTTLNCGEGIQGLSDRAARCDADSLQVLVSRIREHISTFRERHHLDEVIVVNLASTEPLLELQPYHESLGEFESCVRESRFEAVRASTLYAYAALLEGCGYINFTPSNGALFPAMVELAHKMRVPVMGDDGKTGETLVKAALAPLFRSRNLEVLSWEGYNILGNMDGRILDHPENKRSKIRAKDQLLGKILGYAPHSRVHINYVPSLNDQKTAWNYIHFSGFLGARMSLQFVWQGYDSMLAAPLVLDLIRLTELARRKGESGLMPHLAFFFKAPLGVTEHRLAEQFQMLLAHWTGKEKKPTRRNGELQAKNYALRPDTTHERCER